MAENPTNRRAVKFWTSDFGTAVQVATADGWMVVDVGSLGRGRRARVVSSLAGRAGGERLAGRLSLHASSRLCWPAWPGRRHRLTPRITSLIHRRLPTTTTTTATKEGGRAKKC